MNSYFKTILRSVKSNIAKLISITFIILLGVAFIAGLGTLSPTIKDSFNIQVVEQNISDVNVKSTNQKGFTAEELSAFANHPLVSEIMAMTIFDLSTFPGIKLSEVNTRIYILPEQETHINKLEIIEGRLPANANEVAVERSSTVVNSHTIGDIITMQLVPNVHRYEVVGIIGNPMIFDKDGEPDMAVQRPLEEIYYFSTKDALGGVVGGQLPDATDIYLRFEALTDRDIFASSYKNTVANNINTLKYDLGGDNVYLSLQECKSVALLDTYCNKIVTISLIFPIFFTLVVALVVMTTMTRMVEEERAIIGCYKTLGVSDGKITFKYIFLASICSLVAFGIGMGVGLTLLPNVIFPAFTGMFFLPTLSSYVQPWYGIGSFLAMFVVVVGVTAYVVRKNLKCAPSTLLIPKSPKVGKQILLEKIPFIWKRMSFKYKSCFRNIFRYVNHLLMTIISLAGSTALVFAGFALLNVTDSYTTGVFSGIQDTIVPVAIVVIIFALLLCVFVIYNLTNMNIGERKREIATLKVLGYKDIEVIGYMYREIIIMAVMGIAIGLLLGCLLIYFILKYLDFGSIADVKWYTYFVSTGIVMLFVGIVDVLLIPKILKLDMTTSLKSVE